jgi:hypothetical protein
MHGPHLGADRLYICACAANCVAVNVETPSLAMGRQCSS